MPLLLVFLCVIWGAFSYPNTAGWPTWSSLSLPTNDGTQNVTIMQNVVLNQNITLYSLTIYDSKILVVAQNSDITIRVRMINVLSDAEFWIGGEAPNYYTKNAEIIFTGPWSDTSDIGCGDKGMCVYGTVEWHGLPTNPTWSHLTKTAQIGDTSITLADNVPWKVGAQIVIASTDFDQFQSEVVTITSVSGNVVNFAESLEFMHWGDTMKYIDERAEVGLLSKNIKVHGEQVANDPNTIKGPRFGGHTMFVAGSTGHIENVQFYAMGQAGMLARYPVHFHEAGDMSGTYVKQCAFANTFQRCITVHASNNILLQDNVAYNSSGHCYFFEDGIETGNTADHNLGVVANVVADNNLRVIPSDQTQTTVFWITHPNNTITNNVAVGGFLGFWYALPQHPIGLTGQGGEHAQDTWERYSNMGAGQFYNNKAHSTNTGLFVDQGPSATGDTSQLVSYTCRTFNLNSTWANSLSPNQMGSLESVLSDTQKTYPARFEQFTAHHCIDNGAWLRGDNMVVDGLITSNVRTAITMPGGPNLITNAIMIGDTPNTGNPGEGNTFYKSIMQGRSRFFTWNVTYPMLGYQHYDCCGPNVLRNILFVNFTDFNFVFTGETRKTGAITFLNGEHPIPPNTRFWNVKFENVTNRVYYVPDSGFRTALKYAFLVDADGSFTGTCGGVIAPNNPLLLRPACQAVPSWNGYFCPPRTISPRYIESGDAVSTVYTTSATGGASAGSDYANQTTTISGVGAATIVRIDDSVNNWINGVQTTSNATTIFYNQLYRQNLPTQTEYLFLYPTDYGTPRQFYVQADYVPLEEYFRVVVPYPQNTQFLPRNVSGYTNLAAINCNDNINNPQWGACPLKSVSSKDQLVANSYFWDNTLGLLWLHLQPTAQSFQTQFNYTWPNSNPGAYVTATCPNNNCQVSATALKQIKNALYLNPTPYTAPTTNLCYTNGYENKGNKVFSEVGTPKVLFDDVIANGWSVQSWSYANQSIQSAMAVSGSALQMSLNSYQQFQIRTGWNVDYALSNIVDPGVVGEELALIFDIRIGAVAPLLSSLSSQRRDVVNVVASITESNLTPFKSRSWTISVNSPEIFGQGPIDSTQWYHVVVPWSQFTAGGIPSDLTNIVAVSIGVSEGFPSTVYVDNIKLGYVTSSYSAQPVQAYTNLALNPTDAVVNAPLVPAYAVSQGCAPCTGASSSGGGSGGTCSSKSSSSGGYVGAIVALALLFAISTGVAIWLYFELQKSKQIPRLELTSPTSP